MIRTTDNDWKVDWASYTIGDSAMFKAKTLLITGGTGSFGNAVLQRFLKMDIGEIRIFSRDEKKQDDMRRLYRDDRVKYYIGDVRDPGSIRNAMYGVDYVFHAAALKQVPTCEFFSLRGCQDEHHWYGQCAQLCHRLWGQEGYLLVNGQSRVSNQRYGNIESHDGKGVYSQI